MSVHATALIASAHHSGWGHATRARTAAAIALSDVHADATDLDRSSRCFHQHFARAAARPEAHAHRLRIPRLTRFEPPDDRRDVERVVQSAAGLVRVAPAAFVEAERRQKPGQGPRNAL